MFSPKFPVLAVCMVLSSGVLQAATQNIGAVGSSDATGFYFKADNTISTTGQVLIGSFSKSQADLQALISSWGSPAPTYERYTNLLSFFTQVGTGGTHGSVVPGWSFGTNGAIAGTSSGVDTSVIPVGTQMYAWTFTMNSLNSTNFTTDSSTQWGLYTGGTNAGGTNLWRANGATTSLVVNQITPDSILIGSDLSPASSSVTMVAAAAVPEPSTAFLFGIAAVGYGVVFLRRRKENRVN
jgi:hypothetical protein